MKLNDKIVQSEYKDPEEVRKAFKVLAVVIFAAIISGSLFILNFRKESKEVLKQKEQISEVYKEAGINLSKEDYIVEKIEKDGKTEEVVKVKQEKVDEIHKQSNSIINSLNEMFSGGYDNRYDYSNDWNNQPSNDKTEDIEDIPQSDVITPGTIKSVINGQIASANEYLNSSLDKEKNPIYSSALEKMIEAMRSGDENKIKDWYDFHIDTTTNEDAFGVFCSYAKEYSLGDKTIPLWNNSGLGYSKSTVLSSVFINKIEAIDDIELITEDSSKKFSYLDEEVTSTYKVLTKDKKIVYLTENLGLLDVELMS